MKVLVTGATGILGGWLTQALVRAGPPGRSLSKRSHEAGCRRRAKGHHQEERRRDREPHGGELRRGYVGPQQLGCTNRAEQSRTREHQ